MSRDDTRCHDADPQRNGHSIDSYIAAFGATYTCHRMVARRKLLFGCPVRDMGKNLRFVLLGIQALVTLILSAVIVHSIIASVQNGMWVTTRSHLLPSLIHLWVALIAALLLCFFYRANIGAEARVLPLLFLMISLGNVKILPLHHTLTGLFLLNPLNVSVLYHFSLLFGSFLFLSSGPLPTNHQPNQAWPVLFF